MNLLKLLLVLALLFGGYKWWHAHSADQVADQAMLNASPNGFVALQRPAGASDSVLIFAPANCPSDAAKRAKQLAGDLTAQNIPNTLLQSANFDFGAKNPDQQTIATLNRVMKGAVPIVFVRSKAKANPTVSEVIAEYSAN